MQMRPQAGLIASQVLAVIINPYLKPVIVEGHVHVKGGMAKCLHIYLCACVGGGGAALCPCVL